MCSFDDIKCSFSFQEFKVISDLGGQIGLWLGVSMITVFEFVELLFDFAKVIFYKIYRKKYHKKRATAPSQECLQMIDTKKSKKEAQIQRYDSGVFGGYYDGQFQWLTDFKLEANLFHVIRFSKFNSMDLELKHYQFGTEIYFHSLNTCTVVFLLNKQYHKLARHFANFPLFGKLQNNEGSWEWMWRSALWILCD